MRVLIFGSTGFLGRHLAAHLDSLGHQVHGCGRRPEGPPGCERYSVVDLLERASLGELEGPWDAAVVLAGHSVPGASWSDELVLENVAMAASALAHVAARAPAARVLVASSAHVYAAGPGRRREDEAPAPAGPYGLSKQLVENWARHLSDTLDVHIVRPFNHIGTGLPPGLVASDLLQRVQAGLGPITMSGADSVRDFLDVRDGVRALAALLEVDAPSGSTWNLGSGRGVRISELARACLDVLGQEREVRFKKEGGDELVADPTKLELATGFTPEHDLAASLRNVLEAPFG